MGQSKSKPTSNRTRVNAFISHSQSNGQDQAYALSQSLKWKFGWNVWIDQTAPSITSTAMRKAVENCDVFILFLTEGVFERPFVLFELHHAMKNNKPIHLVHEADERHGKFDFNSYSVSSALMQEVDSGCAMASCPIILEKWVKVLLGNHESLPYQRRDYLRNAFLDKLVDRETNNATEYILKIDFSELRDGSQIIPKVATGDVPPKVNGQPKAGGKKEDILHGVWIPGEADLFRVHDKNLFYVPPEVSRRYREKVERRSFFSLFSFKRKNSESDRIPGEKINFSDARLVMWGLIKPGRGSRKIGDIVIVRRNEFRYVYGVLATNENGKTINKWSVKEVASWLNNFSDNADLNTELTAAFKGINGHDLMTKLNSEDKAKTGLRNIHIPLLVQKLVRLLLPPQRYRQQLPVKSMTTVRDFIDKYSPEQSEDFWNWCLGDIHNPEHSDGLRGSGLVNVEEANCRLAPSLRYRSNKYECVCDVKVHDEII